MWVAKELLNNNSGNTLLETYTFKTLDEAVNWIEEYKRLFKKSKSAFILEEQKGQK